MLVPGGYGVATGGPLAWGLCYNHEIRLMRYNKEAQVMNSASINCVQGCFYPNAYKTGDSGGSRGAYGCGGSCGAFSDCGASHGGGRFANFQCQICLKFGHTVNVCHFRSDVTFHPHESLAFIDHTTFPDRKSTRLNSSHYSRSRMPSSA